MTLKFSAFGRTIFTLIFSLVGCFIGSVGVAQIQHPIRIGVFVDLSGRTSNFGESTSNGINMAADELNRSGGIKGRRVELLVKDDQGRPDVAALVARDLINEYDVDVLLSDTASSVSLAGAPVAQAAGVPMIAPSATNPAVTQVGDFIFRTCYVDSFQGRLMADFAVRTLGARRAAILLDSESPFNRSLSFAFSNEFIRLGGRTVIRQTYARLDRDYAAQLLAIRAAKPDVIYVPGYYDAAGMIARQARRLDLTQPLLGGDGWDSTQLWDLGGKSLNGSYITYHYSAADPSALNRKFIAAYKFRYGMLPDAIAALGYDAMNVLADAVRRAGTTDGPSLRDAIARTTNFAGVTGNITIDSERNAIKPTVVLQLKDGKFFYKETVQPD